MSKKERNTAPPLALDAIAGRILLLRGQRVMLDADLAALFGVPTKRFNAAVRRNLARFPADFMFPLTNQDVAALRSQIATLKTGRGQLRQVFEAIRELMSAPDPKRRPIGFINPEEKKRG